MNNLLSVHIPAYRIVSGDYPLREVVWSALPIADEILIACPPADADGTRDYVESIRRLYPGVVKILLLDWWQPEQRQEGSLSDVTNHLIEACSGEWHLSLQADEVIHETQAQTILDLCRQSRAKWYEFERLNFFGTFEAYNGNRERWPSSVCRLARRDAFPHICSYSDATHLGVPLDFNPVTDLRWDARAEVQLWHYSYVRYPRAYVERQKGMAALYGLGEDPRITAWRERGRIDWWEMAPKSELVPIPCPHPQVMEHWIAERRAAVESGVIE